MCACSLQNDVQTHIQLKYIFHFGSLLCNSIGVHYAIVELTLVVLVPGVLPVYVYHAATAASSQFSLHRHSSSPGG